MNKYSKILFLAVIITAGLFLMGCPQITKTENANQIQKWADQLKTTASDAADHDWLGTSVALSGDYAIAGASMDDGSGSDRGSGYIFRRTGTNTWDAGVKIIASDAADSDNFGISAAISGDYAIVGANSEDGTGIDRGAVYIFHRTGINTWDAGVKIIASDAADNDNFGYSVAISGDYAVVGAYGEDGSGTNRGAGYIFHRTGTNTWDAGVKIIASDAADEDYFGISVSISGDYAIAGASMEDGAGTNRGAGYIFHRTGTNTWDTGVKIIASDAADNDYFGNSIAISGNYAVVGAPFENGAGANRGTGYIYYRTGTITWDAGVKITAFDAEDFDGFGNSVSISGEYVIAGAYGENGAGSNRGSGYIFHRTGTNTWDAGVKIIASDASNEDYFGISVSISGNYAIAGAYNEDGAGVNRGAVYIFK